VKQLKSLVRNVVDPGRDLGHIDRALGRENRAAETAPAAAVSVSEPGTTGGARAGAARPSETVAVDVNTAPGMGTSGSAAAASGAARAGTGGEEEKGTERGQEQEQKQGQGRVCEDCQ